MLNDVLKILDKNSQAIIVYDAAKRVAPSVELPSQKLKNVQVVFTNPGESADARIQKLVYGSRQKGMEVQVVTSDLGIQDATMNKGVVRTSSREFVATVSETAKQGGASASALDSKQPMRTKIEDSVDPETAAKLRYLRDSL